MSEAERALYFTYAVGMRERYGDACATNVQSSPIYFPGEDQLTITITGGTFESRNATFYEACYFIFKIKTDVWSSESQLSLKIEEATDLDYYVFKGLDRKTATLLEPQIYDTGLL